MCVNSNGNRDETVTEKMRLAISHDCHICPTINLQYPTTV